MPALILPQVNSGISTDELGDIVAKGFKDIEWMTSGFLDSKNIRNIAGFNVGNTEIKHISGIVGMSGANPSTATAVRFWSGNADPTLAPFRVLQNGKMYATDGEFTGNITGSTITGGTVRTAASGERVEFSGNSLKTYNSSDQLQGLAWGTDVSGAHYGDVFFYDGGNKILEFFNTVANGISIYPSSGFSMRLGISGRDTILRGNLTTSEYTGILKGNGSSGISAISGVSGTFYVAATSGGPTTTAITFTNGVRTA